MQILNKKEKELLLQKVDIKNKEVSEIYKILSQLDIPSRQVEELKGVYTVYLYTIYDKGTQFWCNLRDKYKLNLANLELMLQRSRLESINSVFLIELKGVCHLPVFCTVYIKEGQIYYEITKNTEDYTILQELLKEVKAIEL